MAGDPPVATAGLARIKAHALTVRFEPETHRVIGRDVVTFDTSAGRAFKFLFPPAFTANVPTASDEDGVHHGVLPAGVDRMELAYATTIFDAVQKKDDLSWVVGDATRGLVSEKGIYLTGNSGWYPIDLGDAPPLARFDITTYVPEPFVVVTQGRVPERSRVVAPAGWDSPTDVVPPAAPAAPPGSAEKAAPGKAYAVSAVTAQFETDDLALSAGPYRVTTRTFEGIEISTYFLAGEADAAPLWLAAMEEVLHRYESRLGTYPFPKFDIVENFFQTGYGMPSYTLLGDEVIRYVTAGAKATGKIPPGYLDHEYVHGWYGNGLFVDPSDGNWCEALTSYFSNYLAKELESKDAGRDYRRGVLEKYALRVKPASDYPVRSFRTKTEDKDNDVGYGKGSLIFHVLRKRLGDAEFFARVKRLTEARVGTYVSWKDWLAALDGEWARPFLERTGLPALRIASATCWPGPRRSWNSDVRVEVVIDQPRGEAPWPALDVPLVIDGRPVGDVRVEGGSGVWRGNVNATPKVVEIDPDYDLLRKIVPSDLPACLNRTIEAEKGVIRTSGSSAVFGTLAQRLSREKGLTVLAADRAAPSDTSPVVELRVLGSGEKFAWPTGAAAPRVTIEAGVVTVDGVRHEGKDVSLLLNANDGPAPRTWFIATSEASTARAKYLPFYGWDTFVVFEAGSRTPLARGRLDAGPRATRVAPVDGGPEAIELDRLVEHLASDEFEGRRPGSEGHAKAEEFLISQVEGRLRATGRDVTMQRMPFGLGVADRTSSCDLTIRTATDTVVLKDAFRPICASPAHAKGTPLPFGEGDNPIPLPGRIPDTTAEGLERAWNQIETGSAPALMLLPSPAARAALAPLVDAPNSLTPESEAKLATPGHGGPRPRPVLAPWIRAERARVFPGLRPLRVPVLLLTDEAYERIFALKDVVSVDFEVAFGPEKDATEAGRGGVNLVASWLPDRPDGAKPAVVVVSAHYDSFGRDGERFLRGADDNASGVACVLEAIKGLAAPEAGAKTGLLVCFFDGEEWGLAGSRALAAGLAQRYDVRAVINVDAVGRVKDDQVYVVGLSTHAELGALAADALKAADLHVGRDIDKYAYAQGSDHWPFHETGVPAITYWASDYAVMNTDADNPDKVDPVGVSRLSVAVRALLARLLR